MSIKYFLVNKEEGETPLEALEKFRRTQGIDLSIPMTYAGRLDPMADGLLLILIGDECKNKEEYLGLDKEYEIEVMLGVTSDTGDVLGIVKYDEAQLISGLSFSKEIITEKLKSFIGKRKEKYPIYSSRTVNGKPLFAHTRAGNIDEIDIPEKEIEIYSIEYIGVEEISSDELVESAINRISKVKGDFRQAEIVESWNKFKKLPENLSSKFPILKLRVKSSSG